MRQPKVVPTVTTNEGKGLKSMLGFFFSIFCWRQLFLDFLIAFFLFMYHFTSEGHVHYYNYVGVGVVLKKCHFHIISFKIVPVSDIAYVIIYV